MSYEIKSTPFFQRMLYASKKNGQLQQLKAEYERIKDFNMKAIEMKMRQMRLKRLFQEIEEIKEADFKRRRKGLNEEARDTIATTSSTVSFLSKRQQQEQERDKVKQTKARVNKRTNYGNQISNWNMQKMLTSKLRTKVSEGMKVTAAMSSGPSHLKGAQSTSETSVDDNVKLRHRISYGNTRSDLKLMSKSGRNHKHSNVDTNPDSDETSTQVVTALSNTSQLGEKQYQSCDETQDYLILDNGLLQPLYTCDPEAVRRSMRAQMHWHKLAMLLKYRFDTRSPGRALQLLDQCHEDLDYQLRSISNDTNLPHTGFISQRCEILECSESEETDTYLANEMLVRKQCFHDSMPLFNTPTDDGLSQAIPSPPPLPVMVQQRLSLKPVHATFIGNDEGIQNLIRKYEPYPSVRKEIKELGGVDELCAIFEHQNV